MLFQNHPPILCLSLPVSNFSHNKLTAYTYIHTHHNMQLSTRRVFQLESC